LDKVLLYYEFLFHKISGLIIINNIGVH